MSKMKHLVTLTTWGIDKKLRKEISVDPTRVVITEHYGDAFKSGWGEEFPAATKLVLRDGRVTFIVQGAHSDVVALLNGEGQANPAPQPEDAPETSSEQQRGTNYDL